jgi:hypothetical protein
MRTPTGNVSASEPMGLGSSSDILFRYAGSLVKVRETTVAGQAWLEGLRRRRLGLWNSFAGDALTMTLGRYQELTAFVRRDGLAINLEGRAGTYQPGDFPKWIN